MADQLGLADSVPLGVQQVCNGGAAAIELATARLLAEPRLGRALITTADRFAEPGFDRWRGDYGIGYGDGATAVVLQLPDSGDADLLFHASSTVAAPHLERMHRGTDPFSPAPRSLSPRVDIRRTKKAFLEAEGLDAFTKAGGESLRAAIDSCLHQAGLAADDPRLRYVLPPRLGRKTIDLAYLPVIAATVPAEILRPGKDTGHLGAGDTAASLAEISRKGLLGPGEYALVISAGAGFTWSCLLVSGV